MARLTILFFCAVAGLSSQAQAEEGGPKGPARHLLLQVSLQDGVFRLVKATPVALPLPRKRSGPLAHESWRLTVNDEKGKLLHRAWLADPRWVQAELADPDQPAPTHARVPLPEPVEFAVRVPDVSRARLVFEEVSQVDGRHKATLLGSLDLDVRP